MENPQREEGHIEIASEIVDKFQSYHLSGNEWKILWVVLRKTWGWNKKEDAISLTQFQKLTGLTRKTATITIAKLVSKTILLVDKNTHVNVYRFNKHYSQWSSVEIDTTHKVVSKPTPPSVENDTTLVSKSTPKIVSKPIPTINNINTNTINTNTINKGEIVSANGETIRLNTGGGRWEIQELQAYFLQVFQLPKEDGTQTNSRKYWWVLLKQRNMNIQLVKDLIDLAYKDDFYRNNITCSMDLWSKQVKLIARLRGTAPKIAVMPKEAI